MPYPTNCKQRSKKASEAKEQKNSINIIENSDDSDNTSYNEAVKNNNTTGIIKRLQVATKKYDNNTNFEDYNNDNLFAYNELINKSIYKVAKGTPTLYTFWNQEKSVVEANKIELNDDKEQLEEVDKDDDIRVLLENKIEIHNCSAEQQEKIRSISYFCNKEKHNQDIVFPSDYHILELCGKAKGLKEVLKERELWPKKELRLKKAQELMSQQPDFLVQKGQLEEIIVAARH
ncbi:38684_t:CDS:2 [Gigaspora margarita]|uniref:38684_t:CDS:1 n=1 Tax=Gigaspora margarita TaxID=4874 RepID=A0ABN7VVP4_GIGMA|nr:38684_t:CDS:2 [Gigaspora margarita]